MDERVPVPFVTGATGHQFDPDVCMVRRILFCDGEYKDIGVCQGCGCDIAAGEAVCDGCRKWTGMWARQAAAGACGSVRLCLAELAELERTLSWFSVVDAGGGDEAARLCAGCGCEVGPGLSLCEECEAELMSAQGAVWP